MNGTLIRRVVIVSFVLTAILIPEVFAQAARVFLSGTGTDSGDCSDAAAPCRSLQYAIDQAAAGAEVVIVSSGGYGGATITKSITVNAPTGVIAFIGRTITVTIAGTDTVTLRGLSMNGAVFADPYGINFTAGGTLNIENTVIASFSYALRDVAAGSRLWVNNSDFKKNTSLGIDVEGASASAVIENSRAVENDIGVESYGSATVVVRNSVAAGNSNVGFFVYSLSGTPTEMVIDSCISTNNVTGVRSHQANPGSAATMRVGESVVMNNTNNLVSVMSGAIVSYGGNRIGGATGGTTGFTSTQAQQ